MNAIRSEHIRYLNPAEESHYQRYLAALEHRLALGPCIGYCWYAGESAKGYGVRTLLDDVTRKPIGKREIQRIRGHIRRMDQRGVLIHQHDDAI